MDEDPLEGDLVEKARRVRYWGRPVTDEEADALLAEVDAGRGRLSKLERELAFTLSACAKLTATRDELFETRKRLEIENEQLRHVIFDCATCDFPGPQP